MLSNLRTFARVSRQCLHSDFGGKKIIPRRTIKPADVRASDRTTDQIRKQTAIMKIERGTTANRRGKQQNSVTIRHRNWASFNIFIFDAVVLPRVSNCGIARTAGLCSPPVSEFSFGIFFTRTRAYRKSVH